MGFYKIKDSYSAQIEGAGFNLRIGYTCMGYAFKNWQVRAKELPLWRRLFLPISIGINYHSAQCDQWYRFRIEIGGFQIWYKTDGEGKDKYTGLHVAYHGLKNWKLIF